MKARSRDRLSDSLAFRISVTDRERLEEIAYRQKKPMAEVIRGYVVEGIRREIGA
jgi:predicted DNA-binding protein